MRTGVRVLFPHLRTDVRPAMVNPLLTILFDVFIIGSAIAVSAGMFAEYLVRREPHIGGSGRVELPSQRTVVRSRATAHRIGAQRRRAA